MQEFLSNPAVIAALLIMLSPLSLYVASLFNSGKKRKDLESEEADRVADRAEREAAHQAALDLIRYGQELAAAKQMVAAAEIKAELVATVKAARADDVKAQDLVIQKLDSIAIVGEQTHAASNGARSALEKVEQDLRNQLKATETARVNDAKLAAMELAMIRESAAKDLANEREKNAGLSQQLAAKVLEARAGDTPEVVVSVEQATEPGRIITP